MALLIPHRRDHYMTKICPTNYDPGARCPRFLQFLDELFPSNPDMIDYLQFAFGYGITGATHHHLVFILHGDGANGKSTLMRTLLEVVGPDYAHELNPEELLVHRFGRHMAGIAQLEGKRFVVAQETPAGRELNTALIKALSGGDQMTADLKHKDPRQFAPQCKLFIATNDRPEIRDSSHGLWRRLRCIPFDQTFSGDKADPYLFSKLMSEREGILAWLVEGASRSFGPEPPMPEGVSLATADYRADSDTVAAFMAECTRPDPTGTFRPLMSQVWQAFQMFDKNTRLTARTFPKELRRLGYSSSSGAGNRKVWTGFALEVGE